LEIVIAFGQCPDGVEVVRKDDDGVDGEGAACLDGLEGGPKGNDVLDKAGVLATIDEIDRKEEGAACNGMPPVVGHQERPVFLTQIGAS
jgi:hypothetical protein